MRRGLALLVLVTASCGTPAAVRMTPSPTPYTTSGAVPVLTSGPQVATPTASPPPGVCTQAGLTNAQLVDRWLDLAGKHDVAGVRDCFAKSYGLPETIADRWANLGARTNTEITHGPPGLVNGCDRFGVRADFPYGNPYAPVQDANRMFLFVSVAADGDRPRIFGTATAMVAQSPDVTPHAGPPDCR